MKKMARFFISVKKEMKKVRWLNKKELLKYSISTITFIVLFMAFFALSNVLLSTIVKVVK